MRLTLATLAGIITGAWVALYCRRYIGAYVWWVFTTDQRPGRR